MKGKIWVSQTNNPPSTDSSTSDASSFFVNVWKIARDFPVKSLLICSALDIFIGVVLFFSAFNFLEMSKDSWVVSAIIAFMAIVLGNLYLELKNSRNLKITPISSYAYFFGLVVTAICCYLLNRNMLSLLMIVFYPFFYVMFLWSFTHHNS